MKEYQLTPEGAQELISDIHDGPDVAMSIDLAIMEEIIDWRRAHTCDDYRDLLKGDGRYFGYSNVEVRRTIDYLHHLPMDTLGNFVYLMKMRKDRDFMQKLLCRPACDPY